MKVNIKNRHNLNIALNITANQNNKKLVFLIHGIGARKEYPHMLVLEEEFAKRGYNVVNIDSTNSLNESESSETGLTFTGFYNDLCDVIDWAKSQTFYIEQFSLAGQSLGASAVCHYAANHPNKVDLIISVAFPWVSGKIDVLQNKRRPAILENGFYDQVSRSTGRVLRIYKNYLDDLENYDFSTNASKITARTFLLVGDLDTPHHIDSNKKMFDILKCNKSLTIMKNVPHDTANTPETKNIFTKTLTQILDNL